MYRNGGTEWRTGACTLNININTVPAVVCHLVPLCLCGVSRRIGALTETCNAEADDIRLFYMCSAEATQALIS